MARISSPWVGVGKGKMGEGIYYERKGKIYSKQYRAHINQPKTIKHELDWGNFRVSQKICNTLKDVVKEYWSTAKVGQTNLNSLMSYTRRNALQLVGDVWEPDWEKLRFASGTLIGFKKPINIQVAGDQLVFSWEDNSGIGGARKDDHFVYMLLFTSHATEKIYGQVMCETTTQTRKDESFSLGITAIIHGNLQVYGCFVSADGKKVSDSMYFGEITLGNQVPNTKSQIQNSKEENPSIMPQESNSKVEGESFKVQGENSKPTGEEQEIEDSGGG